MRVLATASVLLAIGCQGGAPSGAPAAGQKDALASPRAPAPAATKIPAGSEDPPGSQADDGNRVVELGLDQVVTSGALRLRLLELDDSRCPLGVQCVWEGQVRATLSVSVDESVSAGYETVELFLRAGVEPVDEVVFDHGLRLLRVEPHPRDGVTPARGSGVVTLEVRLPVD